MDYPENERRSFAYFDGEKQVFADPLAVWRRLLRALDGDFHGAWEDAQPKKVLGDDGKPLPPSDPRVASATLARLAGEERLLGAVREALALPAFDPTTGKGATEEDVQVALDAYCDYLEKKRKSTESSPTSSPATASFPEVAP